MCQPKPCRTPRPRSSPSRMDRSAASSLCTRLWAASLLLLRAPVIALSDSLGGDRLLGYQLGALVCFIPALILGRWLAREIQAQGRSRLEATVFGVLVVINPITLDAVHMGHPEEVLGGDTLPQCWPSSAPLAGGRCLQLSC